jgi:hypothetical protein
MDQPLPKPPRKDQDGDQNQSRVHDRDGPRKGNGLAHALGTGVITGAADDDPSAIGTYASAGAKFGLAFLWIAPVVLPMMYVVVYVSAKLGQVYGKGLFAIVRDRYPRWVLYPIVLGAFTGNVIEAAANLGGIGAALNLLVPVPIGAIVVVAAAAILAFQVSAPTRSCAPSSAGWPWPCSPTWPPRSWRGPTRARSCAARSCPGSASTRISCP